MYSSFGPILSKFDTFICPTNALPSVPADYDFSTDGVEINGDSVDPIHGWCMTPLFNMFSRCPVISVPSGFSRDGIPTGVQIVGLPYCDDTVFTVAHALETALGTLYKNVDPMLSA